ncbi:MAG: zinc ribbon domain-containing protein [Alphaproteobacteria bacterium]|nr:zinc ribbon domain-containing protein [Alphaproteobacteria bacterium]
MARNINNPAENFYVLLGLDFDKPETNASVIKNTIDEKEKEWNGNLNHPTKGKIFSKNVSFIPEMKRLLLLQGNSNEEIAQLTQERLDEANAAKKIVYGPLDDFISRFITDATLTEEKIKALVDLYNRKNSANIAKEIFVKRLPKSIKIVKDAQIEKATSSLSSVDIKKVETNLGILNLKDIYEFLGLSQSCSNEDMESIANQKYNTYSKKPKTSENTAASDLAGIARNFAKSDKREKYDTYLKEKALDKIKEDIEITTVVDKVIPLAKSEAYIKEIMSLMGYDQIQAIKTLTSICEKLRCNAVIPPSLNDKEVKLIRCGLCGRVIEKGTSACPDCGSPLTMSCPKCKTVNETSNNNCSKCGYSFKSVLIAKQHFEKAMKFLEEYDLENAESELMIAEHYDPDNANVKSLKKKLQESSDAVGNGINEIKELILQKKFFSAKSAIIALQKKVANISLEEQKQVVKAALAESNSWVEKAKASASEKILIECLVKALELCVDNAEARSLLINHPPKPASNFRGKPGTNMIMLRWEPSESEGAIYKVVRKENVAPQNDSDGMLVGELSTNNFEDQTAQPNTLYFYTIFACRGGITSSGVSTKTPLCYYSNVSEFVCVGTNNAISMSWEVPQNCIGIEIVRKENSFPNDENDGTKINPSGKSYNDRNLTNGKTYYYKIFAKYTRNGAIYYSSGVCGKAIPSEPIKPIDEFDLKKLGDNLFGIKWGNIPNGSLVLYYSKQKQLFTKGGIKDKKSIEQSLNLLPLIFSAPDKAKATVEENAVYYVYPVIYNGDTGTFCESFIINNVSGFSNVSYTVNNDNAYIRFNWIANANHACLAYKTNGYPTSYDDETAEILMISKSQYESNAAAIIKGIEQLDYYLTVYAVYGSKDSPVYSAGVSVLVCNTPQVEISYSVKEKRGLFSKKDLYVLHIESQSNKDLPRMKIIRKNGTLPPMNANDGVLVSEFEMKSGENTLQFSDSFRGTSCYKIFFCDEDEYKRYKVMATSAKDITIKK